VRASINIGEKIPIRFKGITIIPDGLTETALSEVKNVASLSYTSQLRIYAQFAAENGLILDVYVRPGAHLSAPLLEAQPGGLPNIIDTIPMP